MEKIIGRYELQDELGRGGFGSVFRAYDPSVGRMVAIKILTTAGDPELLKRFRMEAAAPAKLNHPNIVVVYDYGEHDGSPFVVMELLDGADLNTVINGKRQLSLLQRLNIMSQAAAGLSHAHASGIVHRDIKPANIMLLRDGGVKVLDFGTALLTDPATTRLTPTGLVLGTLTYLAPEQFKGADADIPSDIFAFGVTFYKFLTGVHPFEAPNTAELMQNIVNKPPARLQRWNPICPAALEEAISKTLAKDPAQRYPSLECLRADLAPIIRNLENGAAEDWLLNARSLLKAGQYGEAELLLRQILAFDPNNPTIESLLRELTQIRASGPGRARSFLRIPQSTALSTTARDNLKAGRYAEAVQNLEAALVLDKSNIELQVLLNEARSSLAENKSAQLDKEMPLPFTGWSARSPRAMLGPGAIGAAAFSVTSAVLLIATLGTAPHSPPALSDAKLTSQLSVAQPVATPLASRPLTQDAAQDKAYVAITPQTSSDSQKAEAFLSAQSIAHSSIKTSSGAIQTILTDVAPTDLAKEMMRQMQAAGLKCELRYP